MSDQNEVEMMVRGLAARFASVESRQRAQAMTQDELREAVDLARSRAGLPVPSLSEKLNQRGVPARLASVILERKLEETQSLVAARRVIGGEGLLCVLSGKAGSGKSLAAAWALSHRPGLWVHAPSLAHVVVDDDGRPRPDVLHGRMRACGLLVIDDAGTEHSPSGYAGSRIVDAVVAREAALLPTIITTNLGGEDFKTRYGERIASRLNGDPLGFVTVSDPDMRLRRQEYPRGGGDDA